MAIDNARTRTITVAFLAFIGLGMSSGLLGLAWPSMQKQFSLSLDSVNVLFLFSTVTYTLSSIYIGRLMARFGSGTTLLAGTILMAACLFGTATASSWVFIIVLAAISGLGTGALDAGLNMYMATYHSARQMSWLHACFGVGITVGPLIMTYVLSRQLGWQVGYIAVGVGVIGVVLLIAFTRRQWRTEGFVTSENKPVQRASFAETIRVPVIWFSMATYLAYVGLEISIGQWAYTLLTEQRGIAPEIAGLWVSVYWGAFTGGRFLFGILANRFKIELLLRDCMLAVIVGAALFCWQPAYAVNLMGGINSLTHLQIALWWNPANIITFIGVVILGAAQAPVFPSLMSNTAQRVGVEHAENGISMQMGAVGIGAAILPGLIGTIGKNFGLQTMAASFVVMSVLVFACHELTILGRVKQPVLLSVKD